MTTTGTRPVPMAWWLAVGLIAGLQLVVTTSASDAPVLIGFASATLQCVALPLVLLRPRTATAVQFAGVAMIAWSAPDDTGLWPLPVPVMITMIVHVGLIGLSRSWSEAVVTWWASALFCIVLVPGDPRGRVLDDAEEALIIYATISGLALFGAILWRQRVTVRRQLAAAQRDVELEQAQRALVEERNRIARELHDVVAHSMSVIHMQATSAAYRIKEIDAEARAEFGRIAAGTRATLREMRQLLALLRDETADRELAPMPDLERLGELAESARRGGVPVDLEASGDLSAAGLPDTVGLAAYRIVQESLSNVVRHAPGAATRVRVAIADRLLTVEVVNDLPTQTPRPFEDRSRPGHGLVGMRERARLAGGAVEAGPRPSGGYRVAAAFPLSLAEEVA